MREGDTEQNSSDKLVIPMGSDGGMSLMLRNEAVIEPKSSKIVEIDRDDAEQEGQRDGKEVLVVGEEDEEGKRDVDPSATKRRSSKRSLFANQRLRVPSGQMVRRYMEFMMGVANRETIRALQSVPLKHKFACLCRSMAEKYSLEREIKELKIECDDTFKVSKQVKADVDMVMQENQTLESKNEELQIALEGKKDKVKTLEDKVKELQTTLKKETKGKYKAENEVVIVTHNMNKLKDAKVKMDSSLVEKTYENEKLQTSLT
ncbi:hypothetical protein Dimus_013587 [Dionaea muscipula]